MMRIILRQKTNTVKRNKNDAEKNAQKDAMVGYMKNMEYAFKYDDVIKQTKREVAKLRRAKKLGEVPKELDQLALQDEDVTEDVSLIEHYSLYYAMFALLCGTGLSDVSILNPTNDCLEKYQQDKTEQGYRKAYRTLLTVMKSGTCSSTGTSSGTSS